LDILSTGDVLRVSVFEIVGSPYCAVSSDGQKIHDRLAVAFREGYRVSLSFYNVHIVTAAFLNVAIGQLYGEFTEAQIGSALEVSDMDIDDVALLRRVIENTKQYFADLQISETTNQKLLV
jgi:hypothetical protein